MLKIFIFFGFIIQMCLALVLGGIGILLLAFPATYDACRFLAWKLSTKKFQKKWYRKALRRYIAGEMHRFRYGWYDLYVSENAQSWTVTRGQVPTHEDFHRAKPGNEYWRAYVRQQMLSFKWRFAQSQTEETIGIARSMASFL